MISKVTCDCLASLVLEFMCGWLKSLSFGTCRQKKQASQMDPQAPPCHP